jgi:hypothetical protein
MGKQALGQFIGIMSSKKVRIKSNTKTSIEGAGKV